jgi:hypothetical protein
VEGVFLAIFFEEVEEDAKASLRELNPCLEDEGVKTASPSAGVETTGPGAGIETTDPGTSVKTTDPGTGVETTGPGAGVWVPSCMPQ